MTRYIVRRPTRTASLDRFFNDLWNTFPPEKEASSAAPPMDVIEREDSVEVQVNLPGVSPDDVSIEFEGGVLTIATTFENEAEEEGPNYTRRERYHGAYERSLRVPDSFDTQNAAASFENGVLTLTLPKKPEAQPLRIPVNISNN